MDILNETVLPFKQSESYTNELGDVPAGCFFGGTSLLEDQTPSAVGKCL